MVRLLVFGSLALFVGSCAAALVVTVPAVVCTDTRVAISWSGGAAPYSVQVDLTTASVKSLGSGYTATSLTWYNDLAVGSQAEIYIVDATQQGFYSPIFTVQSADACAVSTTASAPAATTSAEAPPSCPV